MPLGALSHVPCRRPLCFRTRETVAARLCVVAPVVAWLCARILTYWYLRFALVQRRASSLLFSTHPAHRYTYLPLSACRGGAYTPVFPPFLRPWFTLAVDLPAKEVRRRDVAASSRTAGGDGSEIRFRQGQPGEGVGGGARDAEPPEALSGKIRPDEIVSPQGGEVRVCLCEG